MVASVSLVIGLRAFGAGLGFLSGIIITRLLGIEESGKYFYVVDLITAIATFVGLGLNNAMIRDIATISDNKNNVKLISARFIAIYKYVFFCSVTTLIFITLLAPSLGSILNKPYVSTLLLIILPLVVLLPLNKYLVSFLQSIEQVKKASIIQFALPYSFLVLILLIWQPTDAISTTIVHAISLCLATIVSIILLRRHFSLKECQTSTVPISGWKSFITIHFFNHAAVILISLINGYFLTASEFSVLTAANRFTLLVSFCLIAFNFVAAPKYAKLYQQQAHEELRRFAQSVTKIVVLIVVPIACILWVMANDVMSLYGKEFRPYGYILSILLFGQVVNAATGSVVYLLTLSGHEKDMKMVSVWIQPSTVIISLILTYSMGLIGVAISLALSSIALNLSAYYYVVKRLGFHTFKLGINK